MSDEIHHDLVMPGHKHHVMPVAAPDIADRLVMMTATTKTFNIAGAHIGNVIISDPALRKTFAGTINAMGISPNSFGMHMATAAYSPAGAAWVDALMRYLEGNRRLFDDGIAKIPGLRSTPLEATYLAWVDFSGTGMAPQEFIARVEKQAAPRSHDVYSPRVIGRICRPAHTKTHDRPVFQPKKRRGHVLDVEPRRIGRKGRGVGVGLERAGVGYGGGGGDCGV